MSALICGSLAFDTIMGYPGQFEKEILPDQLHTLNVAFMVPELRREFGGCAGNIAYSLNLLGGDGKIMGTVGKDFDKYTEWMVQQGISQDYIKRKEDTYTAQAYITTDADGNQITAFHPGAMNFAHEQEVPTNEGFSLGLVSPDGKDGMIAHAKQFADAGIDFIFDPGQGLPMFDGAELKTIIGQASYLALNEYEAQLVCERTGLSEADMAAQLKALFVTKGKDGASIYADGQTYDVPSATPESIQDPTGCGDAFRAGLIYGIQQGFDWPTVGRVASLMGTYKVEQAGTQNHSFTMKEFNQRFSKEFGCEVA